MKNCNNCGYRRFNTCMLSGYLCSTERKYPYECGKNFKKWIVRKTILTKIKNILTKLITKSNTK